MIRSLCFCLSIFKFILVYRKKTIGCNIIPRLNSHGFPERIIHHRIQPSDKLPINIVKRFFTIVSLCSSVSS